MAAPMKKFCLRVSSQMIGVSRQFSASAHTKYAATATKDQREPYLLYGGLILERRAVLTAELSDVEMRYKELLSTLELERSQLSKHELKHKEDQEIALKRLQENFDESTVAAGSLTAQDMEDTWVAENSAFVAGDRETDADRSGNKLTCNRKLDKSVYLLVKQKFHEEPESRWVFPQALVGDEESLRQTCERILCNISPAVDVRILGNAPCAYHKIKYPQRFITDTCPYVGAKIFFMKGQLMSGDVTSLPKSIQDQISDFCWVTQEEALEMLGGRRRRPYRSSIRAALHER